MVSIIVAVYNTEKYLIRCLDSLINQSYKDLQIILIDDGSTDKSGTICEEYTEKDSRIEVYHKMNEGAALARKFALDKAKGDFIQIVDSDDWIENDMVEKMVGKAEAEDLDVVWCDVTIHTENKDFVHHIKFDPDASIMLNYIYKGLVPGWFWNKLFRSKLIKDLIVYKESVFEDIFFSTQLLLKNPRMGYVPVPFYTYNRENNSALTNGNDICIKGIPNIIHCYDYLVENKCLNKYKKSLYNFIIRVKIELINLKRFSEAQSIFPSAHRDISNFPMKMPYSIPYWLGLNLGKVGRFILNIYFRLKHKKIY